uniref:Uncharacterized protein n=1 Tax=Anguilla anguilla TaxID=7936 RepID=A0A0E9XMB8_ANGAN
MTNIEAGVNTGIMLTSKAAGLAFKLFNIPKTTFKNCFSFF